MNGSRGRRGAATSGSRSEDADPMRQMAEAMTTLGEAMRSQMQRSTQPPPPPAADMMVERFLRLKPEKFFGEPDARRAELWLENVENIFGVLQYADQQWIDLATFQFEDAADRKSTRLNSSHAQ